MKSEISNILAWYANKVSLTDRYDHWSDEYCREKIREATDEMLEELKEHIDWDNITCEETFNLRFVKWDSVPNLYLIPLYLLPIIPIGTILTDIYGVDRIHNGEDMGNFTYRGCAIYGIIIKE